jgi:hypothetical protein
MAWRPARTWFADGDYVTPDELNVELGGVAGELNGRIDRDNLGPTTLGFSKFALQTACQVVETVQTGTLVLAPAAAIAGAALGVRVDDVVVATSALQVWQAFVFRNPGEPANLFVEGYWPVAAGAHIVTPYISTGDGGVYDLDDLVVTLGTRDASLYLRAALSITVTAVPEYEVFVRRLLVMEKRR